MKKFLKRVWQRVTDSKKVMSIEEEVIAEKVINAFNDAEYVYLMDDTGAFAKLWLKQKAVYNIKTGDLKVGDLYMYIRRLDKYAEFTKCLPMDKMMNAGPNFGDYIRQEQGLLLVGRL